MNLKDLKQKIEYKETINDLIIFKYSDSDFICHQYLNKILDYSGLEVEIIESLETFRPSSTFFTDSNVIYLYKCIEFSTKSERYKQIKNLFIFCTKIDKSTRELYNDYIIDVPKLERWQKLDYMYYNCPNTAKDIEYLADNLDMYALENEVTKLSIFSKNKLDFDTASFDEKELPKYIYKSLITDGSWDYLPKYTVFDLVQALILADKMTVAKILAYDILIEPITLYSILYTQIKDILKIVFDKAATAESLQISNGKYWAIKYTYNNVSKDRLTKLLRYLDELNINLYIYDENCLDLLVIEFLKEA